MPHALGSSFLPFQTYDSYSYRCSSSPSHLFTVKYGTVLFSFWGSFISSLPFPLTSWDLAKFTHFSSEKKHEVGKDEFLKRLPWKLMGQALVQVGVLYLYNSFYICTRYTYHMHMDIYIYIYMYTYISIYVCVIYQVGTYADITDIRYAYDYILALMLFICMFVESELVRWWNQSYLNSNSCHKSKLAHHVFALRPAITTNLW